MISTDKSPVIRREFPLDGPIAVSVRLGHGSVTVHAVDEVDTATVEITSRSGDASRLLIGRSGRTLAVHAPRQGGLFELVSERRRGLSVDAVVRVPAGSTVQIATFTADIFITGRCGDADLATGTARIDVERVDGDLRLRSGAATATVGDVSGSVTLRSGAGDVTLGAVGGSLQSGSGSGRLTVDSVQREVRARTGAGRIHLGAVHDDVDLGSGSGAMSVGVPSGVTAFVDARTGHGSVTTDFPVEDKPAPGARSITIRARTGSGDVHLHRAG